MTPPQGPLERANVILRNNIKLNLMERRSIEDLCDEVVRLSTENDRLEAERQPFRTVVDMALERGAAMVWPSKHAPELHKSHAREIGAAMAPVVRLAELLGFKEIERAVIVISNTLGGEVEVRFGGKTFHCHVREARYDRTSSSEYDHGDEYTHVHQMFGSPLVELTLELRGYENPVKSDVSSHMRGLAVDSHVVDESLIDRARAIVDNERPMPEPSGGTETEE